MNSTKNYEIQVSENFSITLEMLEKLKTGIFSKPKNQENIITKPSLETRLSALEEALSDFIIALNEGE